MLTYLWRLVRPHVYSVGDYAALIERDPTSLTYGEMSRNISVHERVARFG